MSTSYTNKSYEQTADDILTEEALLYCTWISRLMLLFSCCAFIYTAYKPFTELQSWYQQDSGGTTPIRLPAKLLFHAFVLYYLVQWLGKCFYWVIEVQVNSQRFAAERKATNLQKEIRPLSEVWLLTTPINTVDQLSAALERNANTAPALTLLKSLYASCSSLAARNGVSKPVFWLTNSSIMITTSLWWMYSIYGAVATPASLRPSVVTTIYSLYVGASLLISEYQRIPTLVQHYAVEIRHKTYELKLTPSRWGLRIAVELRSEEEAKGRVCKRTMLGQTFFTDDEIKLKGRLGLVRR